MKLTGHKTEAIYRRYAIVTESDLVEAVRMLQSRHIGRPSGAEPHRNDAAPYADKGEKSL